MLLNRQKLQLRLACTQCRLAKAANEKLEPEIGNAKEFRVPHPNGDKPNKGYEICYFDYKGPILVNDDSDYKTKKEKKSKETNKNIKEPEKEKLKIYILSITCALTRHTTFEVCKNRSYLETKMALQRVFYERGCPRLMISDAEPSFKAVARDFGSKFKNMSQEAITEARETMI